MQVESKVRNSEGITYLRSSREKIRKLLLGVSVSVVTSDKILY